MSQRRRLQGVHQVYAYAQAAGERWVTCACGQQYCCFDAQTAWAMYLQHTQDPAHR